jgi:hypothetical protein
MSRWKSAIIAFVVLAGAFLTVFLFDYTDKYVEDRFNDALAEGQYTSGDPFSLDTFLEYYDWDSVCVVTHEHPEPVLHTQLGNIFTHIQLDETHWMLVLVKDDYVAAEIHIEEAALQHPKEMGNQCLERWEAIVRITDDPSGKRTFEFVSN